jgi:hypothetical protein
MVPCFFSQQNSRSRLITKTISPTARSVGQGSEPAIHAYAFCGYTCMHPKIWDLPKKNIYEGVANIDEAAAPELSDRAASMSATPLVTNKPCRGGATGWSLWAADHPALSPSKARRMIWKSPKLCAACFLPSVRHPLSWVHVRFRTITQRRAPSYSFLRSRAVSCSVCTCDAAIQRHRDGRQ